MKKRLRPLGFPGTRRAENDQERITVNLSVDSGYFNWTGAPPPQPRYSGKPTSWKDETDGQEEIRIKFEKGCDDTGTLQPGYEATVACLFIKLMAHGLRFETFDDGAADLLGHAQCRVKILICRINSELEGRGLALTTNNTLG